MQKTEMAKAFDSVSSLPSEDIKRLFQLFLKNQKESEITKREIKKYESIKDVMIQEITGKYRFYEFFFSHIFSERREAIKKDFEVIDRGMKDNNRDLISTGVSGLSRIVISSPINDMEKLAKLLEN